MRKLQKAHGNMELKGKVNFPGIHSYLSKFSQTVNCKASALLHGCLLSSYYDSAEWI